jgi:hypothetical protein
MLRPAWSGWSALRQVLLITKGQWPHNLSRRHARSTTMVFWQCGLVKFLTFDTPGTTTHFSSLNRISFNKDSSCSIDPLRFHGQQRRGLIEGLASKGKPAVMGTLRGVHNAVCRGRSRYAKGGPYVDKLWTALAVDLRPRPRPSLPPVRFDHGRDGHRHRRPDDPSGQPGAAEQGPAAPRPQHQPHRATGRAGWCNAGRLGHPGCSRSIGGRSTADRRSLCGTAS